MIYRLTPLSIYRIVYVGDPIDSKSIYRNGSWLASFVSTDTDLTVEKVKDTLLATYSHKIKLIESVKILEYSVMSV